MQDKSEIIDKAFIIYRRLSDNAVITDKFFNITVEYFEKKINEGKNGHERTMIIAPPYVKLDKYAAKLTL